MTQEADEELLSAYLDGELSADEQARVERLLADSQAFRQLHDELRALRSSFEALPRHQLPHDLSGHVLRQAEQAMLKGAGLKAAGTKGAEIDGAGLKGANKDDSGEPEPLRLRLPRGWRPWLWPAFALAAALAVMIFNPQNPRGTRKLAKAPTDPPDIAISAAPHASDAPQQDEQMAKPGRPAPENGSPANNVAGEAAADKTQAMPTNAPEASERNAVEKQSTVNRSAEQTANSARALEAPLAKNASRAAPAPAAAATDAAKQVPTLRSDGATPTPAPAQANLAAKASPANSLDTDRKAIDQTAADAVAGTARRSLGKGAAAPAEGAGFKLDIQGALRDAAGGEVLNAMEGVLVVDVVIRPEAAREGIVGNLLAKNKIEIERPTQVAMQQAAGGRALQPDAVKRQAANEVAKKSEVAKENDVAKKNEVANKQDADRPNATPGVAAAPPGVAAAAAPQLAGVAESESGPPAKGDAASPIYVEASRQQIQAALIEMYKDRKKFVAMRVLPAASAPGQRGLGAFTRVPQGPYVPLAGGPPQTVAGSSNYSGQVIGADGKLAPTNSAQSLGSSATSAAPGNAQPAFKIRWGVATKAPATTPSEQLSADPLLASPSGTAAGGNQAAPRAGGFHMESGLTIPGSPAATGPAATAQRHLRVLFLIHVAEPEAPAEPAVAAEPTAPAKPAAAEPAPPAAASPKDSKE